MTVKRRIRSLLLLAIVAMTVVPGLAHAAPADPTVTVFGNKRPIDGAICADPVVGCGVLYANSQPFGVDGPHNAIYFEGTADPSVVIDIVADGEAVDTDGVNVRYRTATAPSTAVPAVDGYGPGAFGWNVPCGYQKCNDLNSMLVTELGVHKATEVNAPGGPNSPDPANWGGSTIYVKFTAHQKGSDGVFFTADDPVSNTVVKTITKYAGTPLDTIKPIFSSAAFPPKHWCHFSGTGMRMPNRGNNLGGDSTGNCGSLSQDGLGAIPDVTWLPFCSDPHRVLIDKSLPSFNNAFGTGSNNAYCRTDAAHSVPTGEFPLKGGVLDDHDGADGLASEIAEIKVEIFKGTALYKPVIILTDAIINGQRPATRTGARVGYALPLKIADFEPNWPSGPFYKVVVTATDAWGNFVTASSGNITVYPY